MAIYRTGTAAMTADGVITGTGTNWQDALSLVRVGATIMFFTSPIKMATISAVVSATELRATDIDGDAVPDGEYVILLSDSLTVDGLAQDVAETLRYYQQQAANFTASFDQKVDKASNLSDLDDLTEAFDNLISSKTATAARDSLGVQYGTAANTVAQGNDSRITGAAQKASNLSDLANLSTGWINLLNARTAATARSDLGVAYGTAAGTVAQGNDSRITGAAQKASNLSDLASLSTAWTNLLNARTVATARADLGLATTSVPFFNSLELSASTPFIDFHYGSSAADYTARIIQDAATKLTILNVQVDAGGGHTSRAGANGAIDTSVPWSLYWNYNSDTRFSAFIGASRVGSLAFDASSDIQLKKDKAYLDGSGALNEVSQWKPASFKYKARGILGESDTQYGFIANDLVLVSPECVRGDGLPDDYDIEKDPNKTGAYYLDQMAIIVKLTQAIQLLNAKVSDLESQLASK